MRSKNGLIVGALLLAFGFSGCYATVPEDGQGSASVTATVAGLSADDVVAIQITVSGPNISPDIVTDLTKDPGTGDWSGTIDSIPAGTNRTFLAEASNASAQMVYSGSATGVTITDGQQVVVNLFLQQTTPPDPFDNTVPLFESLVLSSAQVAPGNDVTVAVVVTDPDPGDVLTLLWQATGGTFDATDVANVVWTAPSTEGPYSLTLSASDSSGATSTLTISIEVGVQFGSGSASVQADINTWPEVENLAPSPTRVDVGETTQLNLTATDPDGDLLTYAWSADCTGTFSDTGAEDSSFTLDADNAGAPCSLTVALDDGRGGSNSANVNIGTGPPISTSAPATFGLEPVLSFVSAGGGVMATYPNPLTLRVTEPVGADTLVTITSASPGMLVANDVTIPAGNDSAVVLLEGLVASAPIDVTANLAGIEQTVQVRVLSGGETPALFALTPDQVDAAPGALVEFSVILDAPAPSGGTTVDLTYSGGGGGPASVAIPEGQNDASVGFTAGAAGSSSTVTALLGGDQRSATVTVLDPALDVVLVFDSTSGMTGEVANLKSQLGDFILPQLRSLYPQSHFAVAEFRDFPVAPFGDPGDFPYRLLQQLTDNLVLAQAAINSITVGGGNDALESGNEALYQVATGEGLSPYIAPTPISFRAGAARVVLAVTSAAFHEPDDYASAFAGAHSESQALGALNAAAIHVVGIASGSAALSQLHTYAVDSGATVLPSELGEPSQCPTGIDASLVQPVAGSCPLVFEIASSGLGLAQDRLVNGIAAVVGAP